MVQLPPWLRYKRQQFYAYAFDATPNTPVNQQQAVTLEGDSFFLLEGINILSRTITDSDLNTLKISFSDTSKGVNWSPNSIVFPNVSGRGDCTKYLSHPTLFKPSSTLLYSINQSTGSVYGSLIGRKIFGLSRDEANFSMKRIWYQYDILIGPLAYSSSNYFPVQTANDSDFYFYKFYSAEGIYYSKTYAPLLMTLRDATTNKNIFNNQTDVQTFTGQQYGLSPTVTAGTLTGKGLSFSVPRLIRRNSTLIVDVTNTSIVSSDPDFGPANFTLEGVRVFD